jgi:hypothetical protein
MARLVPNPVGDVVQPLQRVELAVASLSKELGEIRSLPAIHKELVTLNATMSDVLETLNGIRGDLGGDASGGKKKSRGGAGASR